MFEKILLSQGKGDIFNSRGISNVCFVVGGYDMDEIKKLLIDLIKKSKDIKAISFLYEIAKKILD